MANKIIDLSRLSDFLDSLKEIFSPLTHKHTVSDLTDYVVDSKLSATSTNPIQNKTVNEVLLAFSSDLDNIQADIDGTTDNLSTHTQNSDIHFTATERTKLAGIETGATKTVVDTALSSTSTNPVQNKVINDKLFVIQNDVTEAKSDITKLNDEKANKDEVGAFYVNITDNGNETYSANKTFEEIAVAILLNNRQVIAVYNDMFAPLFFVANEGLVFSLNCIEDGTYGTVYILITSSNEVTLITDVLTAEGIGALPSDTFIPSKTSDLTNDSGFITSASVPVKSINGKTGAVSLTASDVGADASGSASAVQSNLNALNDEFDDHVADTNIHVTSTKQSNWNAAYNHSTTAHARTDATKTAKSSTNGNILINGTETVVYTHPTGTNPHGTTKADVGLGNVDNTSDANKPVSTAQKAAIDAVQTNVNTLNDEFDDHVADTTAHMTSTQKSQLTTAYNHSQSAHLQVEDSVTSTSTTTAATPNSVKKAYDLANTANTNATQAKTAVTTHNTANDAHSDIRLLITNLATQVNNFLDVDDTTKDELSEIIALIEANADSIESITSGKVNVADIINNLTTNVSNKPLSAAQGVELKRLIDALQSEHDTEITNIINGTTAVAKATNATSATNAATATYATKASSATKATTASKAGTATYATNSGTATYGTNAGTATYAINSGTATYATSAGSAAKATSATSAVYSSNAVNASTAVNAVNADTATYSVNAGTATYATKSGTATRATNADTATYAINSGTSTYSSNSAKASSATSARYATTATKAGTATYATNSGTSTYSNNSAKASSATSATYASTATKAGTASYAPAYLPLAGGDVTGHIYLTGAQESSSAGNTSQLVFGTSSNNHVVVSSNQDALIINPDVNTTSPQIVLYLRKPSQFPNGLQTNSTLSVSGATTLTGAVDAKSSVTIGSGVTLQYDTTDECLDFIFA